MKLDVQLDAPLEDSAARARELVACGVDGLFTFEGGHDVFLPLALAAQAVEADLMTNVAIALPRSPLHLAHMAYDLHTLSGGRFRLGLGAQTRPHIEKRYGATWSRPAARMRETVAAVRAILDAWESGTAPDFRGEFTTHTFMPPMFDPGPNPYGRPEVCMGALGPVMTRTAAEVADGLLVMPFNTARHFREHTLPAVDEGLKRSGRTRAEFAIHPQVIVATGRTPDELERARKGARSLLAFYGSTPAYRRVLDAHGWGETQPRLNALLKAGETAAMNSLITDGMAAELSVHGTPEECAEQILERFGDHADRVCCYFPGYEVSDAHIADLAAAVAS
ncbi:TIGR03617 family F420-dependent LLM class oxidoreductase [Tomitella fengzijianii]|uniref:TIGR03617 family F420-dependent LLM class oxidoreductase n=1 Tax=Tomitella fengzijianii TaxID=2597660 RepID=A0A516WZ60_9ACTN|nr:TIGR03617 family F420-dependent LLM class oxidoreductase [Tomitella fengzijianii]QDQ96118.1 TIGR03617 family F420-dependent LLM class oxidoreductase [Tomitella fengzijianii]